MKKVLLFLAISAFTFAGDAAGEKAVRESLGKFLEAAQKGDEATLKSVLGDGLVYAHSSAKVENKAECIASLSKGKRYELKPGWTVQMYGTAAVVHGQMLAHNATGNTPLDFTMTWVKVGNGWQMVSRHTAKLPKLP
jgi:hypothetical protein